MKLYIVGPEDKGEGVYYILTQDGECLATHFCSSSGYARGDLEAHREERQKKWKERFGEYRVLWIGEDDLTLEELLRRNKELGDGGEPPEEEKAGVTLTFSS